MIKAEVAINRPDTELVLAHQPLHCERAIVR